MESAARSIRARRAATCVQQTTSCAGVPSSEDLVVCISERFQSALLAADSMLVKIYTLRILHIIHRNGKKSLKSRYQQLLIGCNK